MCALACHTNYIFVSCKLRSAYFEQRPKKVCYNLCRSVGSRAGSLGYSVRCYRYSGILVFKKAKAQVQKCSSNNDTWAPTQLHVCKRCSGTRTSCKKANKMANVLCPQTHAYLCVCVGLCVVTAARDKRI